MTRRRTPNVHTCILYLQMKCQTIISSTGQVISLCFYLFRVMAMIDFISPAVEARAPPGNGYLSPIGQSGSTAATCHLCRSYEQGRA